MEPDRTCDVRDPPPTLLEFKHHILSPADLQRETHRLLFFLSSRVNHRPRVTNVYDDDFINKVTIFYDDDFINKVTIFTMTNLLIR